MGWAGGALLALGAFVLLSSLLRGLCPAPHPAGGCPSAASETGPLPRLPAAEDPDSEPGQALGCSHGASRGAAQARGDRRGLHLWVGGLSQNCGHFVKAP